MRLKSYLRGIGIGILVTAAIFMISGGLRKDSTMTDEQVKARAKELGMSEQVTLVEPTSAVAEEKAESETPTPTTIVKAESTKKEEAKADTADSKKEETKADTADSKKEEAKADTADGKKEDAKADTADSKKEETKADTADSKKEEETEAGDVTAEEVDNKTIIIVVNSGDSSETVSRKLFEAGIVADAREYDKYLMENGYDRTITVGNHKISVTASKEEIAKNLNSPTR